jgi:alpha-amylase/alpha-mannosidase (GH57 family)
MNRVHLVLLWHMHQPLYRDPGTGRYLMPWARLHALKDYWGMVKILEEFPGVRATVNVVPSLAMQIEEYASGSFAEPWLRLAFQPAEELRPAENLEILDRAFQVNRENLMSRWPRYVELFHRVQDQGASAAAEAFGPRDWRDLQFLSQLAWMDEEYLANDPVTSALSKKGANYTEEDKQQLRAKQQELLARVLPEYRRARERGQIELSTTPFYHPILPLLCDTDVARVANPQTPVPQPPFRHPEDAREQLLRARQYHERVFGQPPAGLWPSEGSVSDAALEIAAELGFRWFATDEGVLGRTLSVGFGRDASGVPANADRLYSPLRVKLGAREIVGFFRDHYFSDLIGFVYSRMPEQAAEDLHRRIRAIGERVDQGRPLTLVIALDGENAWEYYPGNGRAFLRQFYDHIQNDGDIRALSASEALAEAGEIPSVDHIFPGSWINANFDIWIGDQEDVRAWELLRDAREFYSQAAGRHAAGQPGAPGVEQLAKAYESLLAAEGSDWCWWYGPQHSTANDPEFDALYREHLTEVYISLGAPVPEQLASPIKLKTERALVVPPSACLQVRVDGRESSYFEWLGAGLYSAARQGGTMHGRAHYLHELRYGFDDQNLYLRVDAFPEALRELQDWEFRVRVQAQEEVRLTVRVENTHLAGFQLESNRSDVTPTSAEPGLEVAFDKILEVRLGRKLLGVPPRGTLSVGVGLWQGGLPVDLLPAEGSLEIRLGTEAFAWELTEKS